MTTFIELQTRLKTLGNKSTVYQHLIDYLEGEFRSHGGEKAKKVLLNDVKQPIPDDTFAEVVGELFSGLTSATQEVATINGMPMAPVVPVVAVPAPAPVVAPVPAKKSKSTTQGDVPS